MLMVVKLVFKADEEVLNYFILDLHQLFPYLPYLHLHHDLGLANFLQPAHTHINSLLGPSPASNPETPEPQDTISFIAHLQIDKLLSNAILILLDLTRPDFQPKFFWFWAMMGGEGILGMHFYFLNFYY